MFYAQSTIAVISGRIGVRKCLKTINAASYWPPWVCVLSTVVLLCTPSVSVATDNERLPRLWKTRWCVRDSDWSMWFPRRPTSWTGQQPEKDTKCLWTTLAGLFLTGVDIIIARSSLSSFCNSKQSWVFSFPQTECLTNYWRLSINIHAAHT